MIGEGFYQVPMLASVIDSALSLARKEALRGADALHLASAVLLAAFLEERRNDLVFVGSDRELNALAERLGLSVIDPAHGR
jgi:predicted nucleic acid-binding protein